MDLLLLVASGISVLAAVASAWFARKNNVRDIQTQLDDVSLWVEKAVRTSRTARMREVRAATREDASNIPPPELKISEEAPPGEIKKALRARVFGRGTSQH